MAYKLDSFSMEVSVLRSALSFLGGLYKENGYHLKALVE